MQSKQNKLGVRPETYRKYKRAAKQGRRSLAETADIAIDELLKRPPVAGDAQQALASADQSAVSVK